MKSIDKQLEQSEGDYWQDLGDYEPVVEQALAHMQEEEMLREMWARQGNVWRDDADGIALIEARLGWLDLPETMRIEVPRLEALVLELQEETIERAVLMGMGGSSLAPEVMREVLGVAPGFLDLTVLDTTDPAQISRAERESDLERTIFIAASKSGTTAETLSLLAYFQRRMEETVEDEWPGHFIVITDPETPLLELAQEEHFRAAYINPPSIGGRYSALSLFGLVPAVLVGIDCNRLLRQAKEMAIRCRAVVPAAENTAAKLGAAMGALAKEGRDKLTLLTSPSLAPFGAWAEQLIAESTGKEGVGIVPVEGEPILPIDAYGADRFFVYVRYAEDDNETLDALSEDLVEAGHPLVVLSMSDLYELGAEFFRWEFATAVAGYLLGINPFDQPNVDAAKERAREALQRYEESGEMESMQPVLRDGSMVVYGEALDTESASEYIRRFLSQAESGDYIALMAYIDRNDAHSQQLDSIRKSLSERLGIAVTVGFGPRFLHSTGQIHKGGPDSGLFVQIIQQEDDDLEIPEREYTFGILKGAQATGDMLALQERDRRIVRISIGADVEKGLERLEETFSLALE